MSANTIAENKDRAQFNDQSTFWLFGYGSLIFKTDFPFIETRPATIKGWERRFWQGSHDHRGTEIAPGRVVTLTQVANATCKGLGYRIQPEVLDHLDHREKNGYLRFKTPLNFDDQSSEDGLVYIATKDNAAYQGPAPILAIAQQIIHAEGPSGRNIDYLFQLANALRTLSVEEDHVFEVERTVMENVNNPQLPKHSPLR